MAWATGEPMDLRERVFNWSPVEAGSGGMAWCVEQELCPTFMPGDLVVPDKLSGHKKPAIGTAIRAKGARLLVLPPYSPDLNPIEQVFTKLRHLLRKAAERTKEATWQRIGSLLDAFTAQECKNYLAKAGYAST